MAIEFVKKDNTWTATKTVDGKTTTIIVTDTDGDGVMENHDCFKVNGKFSVFTPSEIKQALSTVGYRQTTTDTTKKGENINYKYENIDFNKDNKKITVKNNTEYNVGSLFNALPNPKSTSTGNSASAASLPFSKFDMASMMGNMGGFGGGFGGGFSGIDSTGAGGSAFTLNPLAAFGLNKIGNSIASGLAAYSTAPTDSISANNFGNSMPSWLMPQFDLMTASVINGMTSMKFAEKYTSKNFFDLSTPITKTETEKTAEEKAAAEKAAAGTDEVTLSSDEDAPPVAPKTGAGAGAKKSTITGTKFHAGETVDETNPNNKIKKYNVDANHRVWETYDKDNKLIRKSDFSKNSYKSTLYGSNGKVTYIQNGTDTNNYISYGYDDKMNIISTITVKNGKASPVDHTKYIRQADGTLKSETDVLKTAAGIKNKRTAEATTQIAAWTKLQKEAEAKCKSAKPGELVEANKKVAEIKESIKAWETYRDSKELNQLATDLENAWKTYDKAKTDEEKEEAAKLVDKIGKKIKKVESDLKAGETTNSLAVTDVSKMVDDYAKNNHYAYTS